jgi:phosphoglycerol transferase MdoB-like AlkP superfamily enzyme
MDITGGQIDILPTVANLMGFEVPYAMGKDLLNSEEGYAILRGGSYITDSYIYISNLGEAFDKKTGRKLEEKEYEKDFERFEKELEVSDTILHKNAFKYKLNIN